MCSLAKEKDKMEDFEFLFDKKEEVVKALTVKMLKQLDQFGPYQIEVKKTSLHIVKEKAFLGVHPKKKWLDLNLVSNMPLEHLLITKVEQVSKNRYHNNLRLSSLNDIDKAVIELLKITYER